VRRGLRVVLGGGSGGCLAQAIFEKSGGCLPHEIAQKSGGCLPPHPRRYFSKKRGAGFGFGGWV
jgi:hypothetical protein